MSFVELIQFLLPFIVCKMLSSYQMIYVGPTPPLPLILNRRGRGVNRKNTKANKQ
jgi:hypothetical protein